MPVVNSPLGRFRFPDDMPMEAIDAEMSAIHQPEPAPPQGNNFASALRNSFFPEQQAAPDVLPVISAPGLSPQNGDRLRSIIGGQKQLDASEMLRQRANREKAIEAAKERSQELKLRKQERDNRILEAQMKLDGDMKVIQSEAEAGKIWETNDGSLVRGYQDPVTKKWTTEVLRQGVPKPEKPVRGVLYDNLLLDPTTGETITTLPEKTAPQKPQFVRNYPYPNEDGTTSYMDGWITPPTDPNEQGGTFTPAGPTKQNPRVGIGPNGEYQEIVPGAPVPDRPLSPRDRIEIRKMAGDMAYEQDPEFDTKTSAEKAQAVKQIEDSIIAEFSGAGANTVTPGVPVGPTIGGVGSTVDESGLSGLPDGSIVKDPDTGARFVVRGGVPIPVGK